MSPEIETDGVEQLDETELVRVAMRITMTAISELQAKAMVESLNEVEIMKEYIRMCPYVSPNSPVVQAALNGLSTTKCEDEYVKVPTIERSTSFDSNPTAEMQPDQLIKFEDLKNKGALNFPLNDEMDSGLHAKNMYFSIFWKALGYIFRTVLLDLPLAILFASYLAALWTHHVHDMYLEPQIRALVWDDERMYAEETYYKRRCDVNDMSAFDGADLFLSINATAEEAYHHQLIHGLTVFPSVLTDKTATELRNYVRSKNFRLPEEESIFVIENDNRYSFGLGTEEPSVANAMMELASNERLKPALEKVLGPNPALIEMTAITIIYGAKPQYWHDDVIARASAMQFAHAFGPSYSIFVQLQNTTKEMGATGACPGTHFCASGSMDEFCDEEGFEVVNGEGYWRAGDAVLMNMNTYHRGGAHTLKGGEDRVMLILTFVPQPRTAAESRQMAQGITFSLRWDMWGHTLDDLANAKTRMSQPWATLRALGLYKQKDASWGVDYISGSSMRIANEDNGFREDQLEDFMDHGLGPLPKFLYGEINTETEGWREFYFATLVKCEDFLKSLNVATLAAYLMLQSVILMTGLLRGGKSRSLRRYGWVIARLFITHAVVYLLYLASIQHVENTEWARDITAGRRYTNPFKIRDNEFEGPTAWPHRDDVLIETRYKTEALAMYNDFVMAHPGNREWKALLDSTAPLYTTYIELPPIFRSQLPEYMVSSMETQNRRFLYQSQESHWFLLSRDDALKYSKEQIQIASNPVLRQLYTVSEYLISDLSTGFTRDYTMTREHVLPHMIAFKDKLLGPTDEKSTLRLARPLSELESEGQVPPAPNTFLSLFTLRKPLSNARVERRRVTLSIDFEPEEPSPDAWILEGDVVEALEKRPPKNYPKWYYGKVEHISSSGWFLIKFSNGITRYIQQQFIRSYEPFFVGESVDLSNGGKFRAGKIVHVYDDGDHVDVLLTKTGKTVSGVFKSNIRRANKKRIVKERVTQYY